VKSKRKKEKRAASLGNSQPESNTASSLTIDSTSVTVNGQLVVKDEWYWLQEDACNTAGLLCDIAEEPDMQYILRPNGGRFYIDDIIEAIDYGLERWKQRQAKGGSK